MKNHRFRRILSLILVAALLAGFYVPGAQAASTGLSWKETDREIKPDMSDRIAVMNQGVLEQIGTPNDIYYHPKTSYVASFVGNANIFSEGQTYAIRTENILMNGEPECTREAIVREKSFAGGQLRILFELAGGARLTASRYGIDTDVQVGDRIWIGWHKEHAVPVEENRKQVGADYEI